MNTKKKLPTPISKNTDLFLLLQLFDKNYPILNCFYNISFHCGNEITMQGHFNDIIFDFLLLNGFVVLRQSKFNDDSLHIHLTKRIYMDDQFAVINIALIDKNY
jgi:hypothetical protein